VTELTLLPAFALNLNFILLVYKEAHNPPGLLKTQYKMADVESKLFPPDLYVLLGYYEYKLCPGVHLHLKNE
jgi:hypothetical protein